MPLVIASDHAGFPLKQDLKQVLDAQKLEYQDLGAHTIDPTDDYSDFALAVGEAIRAGKADRGILICGSGVGVCIAANKIPGVRACMCADTYSAHQGVEHDEMNVLVMGARITGPALAEDILNAFLGAKFQSQEPRFVRRLDKVKAIERQFMCEPGPPSS